MSVENLKRLIVLVEASQPLPADISFWLLDGIKKYQNGCQLEKALNLCTRRERDAYLKLAWNSISLCEISDWERARRLSEEIKRFQARVWPKYQNHNSLPSNYNACERNLFLAHKTGERIPSSDRQLYELFKVTEEKC